MIKSPRASPNRTGAADHPLVRMHCAILFLELPSQAEDHGHHHQICCWPYDPTNASLSGAIPYCSSLVRQVISNHVPCLCFYHFFCRMLWLAWRAVDSSFKCRLEALVVIICDAIFAIICCRACCGWVVQMPRHWMEVPVVWNWKWRYYYHFIAVSCCLLFSTEV